MISAAGAWRPAVLRAVIESAAAAHGVHEALVTGSKRFSYAELYANSLQRAQSLHALGIRRGDHIGILMGNNAAWVTLFFGAAMIGAVTVPVNTRFKASELAFCLKQADVKALFVADKFLKIDFVVFLREVEPAVDGTLPGSALPVLQYVIVLGDDVPKAALAWQTFEALPMPCIAVLEGPAVEASCEIAAACDFIIATDKASFKTPEALWGTVGATQRLPRILGKRLAKDMMFTGRVLSAQEAHGIGLVARIVPSVDNAAALGAILHEVADAICKAPAAALKLAKRCVDTGIEQTPKEALQTELDAIEENLARNNWKAGIAGFGTKPPSN